MEHSEYTELYSPHIYPSDFFFLRRSLRHAAYRQLSWWVHGYLGKSIWRVIPSCVVKKIRAEFPAQNGLYTGYRGEEEDDSAFDNELEQAWRDFLQI